MNRREAQAPKTTGKGRNVRSQKVMQQHETAPCMCNNSKLSQHYAEKLDSFCYLKSSCNFGHTRLDYMICVHSGPNAPKLWTIYRVWYTRV